jgi:D-galactose 1-dehydrogenase
MLFSTPVQNMKLAMGASLRPAPPSVSGLRPKGCRLRGLNLSSQAGVVDRMPVKLAIIGLGKIARGSHVPAIGGLGEIELTAAVDPSGVGLPGIAAFASCEELLGTYRGSLDAVAICTPPAPRFAIAKKCLEAGLHVLLEKPPATTVGEASCLLALAQHRGVTAFSPWHHRYNQAVDRAREYLRGRALRRFDVRWAEDWRTWHPGQDWVWQPKGFGVFDPGINAISLLTFLRGPRLLVNSASLAYPAGKQAPIRADLDLSYDDGCPGKAFLDWSGEGPETGEIEFLLATGERAWLKHSGEEFLAGGESFRAGRACEYERVYARFLELIGTRACDLDLEPLRVTADAFLVAHHGGVADVR